MPHPLRMPALGQSSDDLRLLTWFKQEGDAVAEGEPLYEVESDKTIIEVESVASGTLLKKLIAAGETVPSGTVIGWLGRAGEEIPPGPAEPGESTVPASTGVPRALAAATATATDGRALATPAARSLAKALGIGLSGLSGTGPGGRIERRDVEAFSQAGPERSAPATDVPGPAEGASADSPVPARRLMIARRLEQAAAVPQYSVSKAVDVRPIDAVRAQNPGTTYTHVLVRAVARALRVCPDVNRTWVEDGPRYRQLGQANVGIAISGDNDLTVATLPEPDLLTWADLSALTRRVVAQAREGRLAREFLGPAAVTVTNLGMWGVDRFDAIVDLGQTAILAAGAARPAPWVEDGSVIVVPQLDLTLSADHRVVDGVAAARFLTTIVEALATP